MVRDEHCAIAARPSTDARTAAVVASSPELTLCEHRIRDIIAAIAFRTIVYNSVRASADCDETVPRPA